MAYCYVIATIFFATTHDLTIFDTIFFKGCIYFIIETSWSALFAFINKPMRLGYNWFWNLLLQSCILEISETVNSGFGKGVYHFSLVVHTIHTLIINFFQHRYV